MASNTSKVFIDIITQFTGTKSIKQAETSFNKLAKSIGRVVSVTAIEEFSRRSIKAFLADDAAANQLVKTLDNLGIAFSPSGLEAYIQKLQDTTGVLDDQLRPAFAQLAVATKDYKTSQELLNTALDVSQGTGKKLSAVTTALSKAYLGNFTAVSRLGAGISKAQIKAGNFNDIQKTLNENFGGSALAAADTYAGKIRILGAAFKDVQEIIGKGFVDAFVTLTGPNGSATQFAQSMKDAGLYIADVIRGLGIVSAKLKSLGGGITINKRTAALFGFLTKSIPDLFADLGKKSRTTGGSSDTYSRQKQLLVAQNKSVQVSKELVKTGNAQTKAAKDKLLAEKASLVLKAAAKVLDVDQAQIMAALMRDLSEEDRNRLKLQQALLNENADAAGKLAQTILASQQAALLAEKTNPFGHWNDSLQGVLDSLRQMAIELAALGSKVVIPTSDALTLAKDASAALLDSMDNSFEINNFETDKAIQDLKDAIAKSKNVEDILKSMLGGTSSSMSDSPLSSFGGASGNTFSPGSIGGVGNPMGAVTINLVLDGQVLGTAVTNQQNDSTASGVVVSTTRLNPNYAGGA